MQRSIGRQHFRDGNKYWSVPRLIFLAKDLKVFSIPMQGFNSYNLAPVATDTVDFVMHLDLVVNADMQYPIILDQEGFVMDGRHRVLHAMLNKHKSIKAVRFDKTPDCCYVKED